ncbi:MAG: DUF4215 domain-containing protein [Nannocystaceae bacterium]
MPMLPCRPLAPLHVAALAIVAAVALPPAAASAATIPGEVVVRIGDIPMGETEAVTVLNSPFTNGAGQVGFSGRFASDYFVWNGDGVVWRNSDEKIESLTGAEVTVGVGDKGFFIYSPSISANDGVWTHMGFLAKRGQQAPGFPPNTLSTFHSRPAMTPDGVAYWIAGFNENGGGTSEGRMLYRAVDGDPNNIELLMRSDDLIGGLPIRRPDGIGLDFAVSDDTNHLTTFILFETGDTNTDGAIVVDGVIVARESMPTGDGDNWSFFRLVSINNEGNHLFAGDTDGDTATDAFIAYNGVIGVREGDVIDGVQLPAGASVNALSLSNLGTAVFHWTFGNNESLFYACDAADLGSAKLVLSRNDGLDVDDDQVSDFGITDLNASASVGPGLQLAEDGKIYVNLDLDDGNTNVAAVVGVDVPSCCGDGKVLMGLEACDDGNDVDTDDCLSGCVLASCGDGFLHDGVEECDDGNDVDTDDCPTTCATATCGDGFVQDGVEACDDGNADDTDACVSGCVAAACGDGFVQAGVEECDDGNTEDGDGCTANCVVEGMMTTGTDTDTDTGTTTDASTTDVSTTDVSTTDVSTTDVSTTDVSTTATSETTGMTSASTTTSATSGQSTTVTSGTSASSSGDTDTDTDDSATTSGGVIDDGGCNCAVDGAPLPGLGGLAALGILGIGRRRRRRSCR